MESPFLVQFQRHNGFPVDIPMEPFGAFGLKAVTKVYDGGQTIGKDYGENEGRIEYPVPSALAFYPSLENTLLLMAYLSTKSPIFKSNQHRSHAGHHAYYNLPQLNTMLKSLPWDTPRQTVLGNYIYMGFLLDITDKRDVQDTFGIKLHLVRYGIHEVANIWALCPTKPQQGSYLFLALSKRTRGYEEREEKALNTRTYPELREEIVKDLTDKFEAKLASESDPKKKGTLRRMREELTDIKRLQYWKYVPYVSHTQDGDHTYIKTADWRGSFQPIGQDHGMFMAQTLDPARASRTSVFVDGSIGSGDVHFKQHDLQGWAENCAKTKITVSNNRLLLHY
jgi:hypothetical protein